MKRRCFSLWALAFCVSVSTSISSCSVTTFLSLALFLCHICFPSFSLPLPFSITISSSFFFFAGQSMQCNSVIQKSEFQSVTRGNEVTLLCIYNSDYSNPDLFWYRIHPNHSFQFILYRDNTYSLDADFTQGRFSVHHNVRGKAFHLVISSVQIEDSAIYYCALASTVRQVPRKSAHKPHSLLGEPNVIVLLMMFKTGPGSVGSQICLLSHRDLVMPRFAPRLPMEQYILCVSLWCLYLCEHWLSPQAIIP